MQIQRVADPERRSHLLKKVPASRTGFSIRFSPVAHLNQRMIASQVSTILQRWKRASAGSRKLTASGFQCCLPCADAKA
jgi:hypothetical protein